MRGCSLTGDSALKSPRSKLTSSKRVTENLRIMVLPKKDWARVSSTHPATSSGMNTDQRRHAGQLTAKEWEDVLENCGALYGWYVDRQNNKIVQAPMPGMLYSVDDTTFCC